MIDLSTTVLHERIFEFSTQEKNKHKRWLPPVKSK